MIWIVILAVGFGSYVFRLGPLLLFERISLTERQDRLIRDAGTSAITALIVVSTRHSATGRAALPTLLAVSVAIVLAARGASMLRLLACGGGIYASATVLIGLLAR